MFLLNNCYLGSGFKEDFLGYGFFNVNNNNQKRLNVNYVISINGHDNGFVNNLYEQERHEFFMRRAIDLAKQGAELGQVPVGALIVMKNEIIAEGFNEIEVSPDPTAHAEIICIRKAANALDCWRLLDTTLYVTLEPCPMCAGAILQSRIQNLIYGARNPLLGADGSWINMFQAQKMPSNALYPVRPHPFHPEIQVEGGILEEECSQIMKNFFKETRQKQDQLKLSRQHALVEVKIGSNS
eukprot:TRINITY_DN49_c0_g2_i1.p1 TRINITY_DN49_c0_g2~~TRINITY_DN49_c0_g2_i1.p1  ORF type:complete len:240 (-),score=19.25 TRINITY_DN49_c0_g2_i1:282-1001(-)